MMEFEHTQHFPAGLDRLWAVFSHPEYPLCKYRALGASAVRLLRFDVTKQLIEVELERDVPVDVAGLPAWARQLLTRQQTLHHRSRWRRLSPTQISAELEITPVGLPLQARGAGALVQTAPNLSRMALRWQLTSRVPLIGPRLERLFARQLRQALDADHAFTLEYLRRPV